eukprot:gene7523-9020_t
MSKFYPAHVAHESFGAGAQKLSARAIYRIPYTASPNHVLWLHPIEQLKHIPLTRELNNFMEYVQLDNEEEEEQCRSHILADLEDIVAELFPGAQVSLFGSYAGGFSTFTSDLDMTVMFPNRRCGNVSQDFAVNGGASRVMEKSTMETQIIGNLTTADNQRKGVVFEQSQHETNDESTYDREELRVQNAFKLEELYEELKSARWVQRIEYRPRARVPIINLSHRSGVECDISMDLPLQSTLHVVRALLQRCGPALAKLSAFLKIYLNQLGLDAPFTGGLGSYKLYVLLAKRIETQPQDMTLGDRLIDFLGHYGKPQNLNEHTIVEVEDAESASFERTSKVQEIQSAFAIAHRVLRDSARNAENPDGAKKKYIGCIQASCSALAELLDTERLCRERMHRRTLCHQYIASTAGTIPSAKEVMDMAPTEGGDENDKEDVCNAITEQNHMLPSSASSESLAELHEQLGTLKSRLLERRSAAAAGSQIQASLDPFLAPSTSNGVVFTYGSADPRLVFNPTDSVGKRIVAGTETLPARMIVAEDKKMFLPAETQQRLGPFHSLHLGERYTQKSLEELEMLQNQHRMHVARLKEALSQTLVPPSSLKVFSPLTDYGKLILAGELPIPEQMKISQQQRQRIEKEQHCRDGLAKLIDLKQRARSRSSSRSGSFSESEPDKSDKTSAATVENGAAFSTRCNDTVSIESFSESGVDFERCDSFAEDWKACDVEMLGDAKGSDSDDTLTVGWFFDRIPAVEEPVSAVNAILSDPPHIRHDWSPMRAPDLRIVEKYKHCGPLSPPLTPSVVATPALSVGVSSTKTHTDASCGGKKQRTEQATGVKVVVLSAPSIPASRTAPCAPTRDGLLQNDSPPITSTVTSAAISAQGQAGPHLSSASSLALEVTSSSEGSASKPRGKRPLPSAMQFELSRPLSRMTKRTDAVILSPLVKTADQCGATLKQETNFRQKRQKIEQIDQSVLTANSPSFVTPSLSAKLDAGASAQALVATIGSDPCTVVTRSVTPQQEDLTTTHDSPVVVSETAAESALAKGDVKKLVSSKAHSAAGSSSTASKITYGKTALISIQPVQVGATTVSSPRKIAKKASVPADMFTNIVSAKSATSNFSSTGIRMPSSKTNKQSRTVPVSLSTPYASVVSHQHAVLSAPQTRVGLGIHSYIPPAAPQSAPVPHPPPLQILPPQSYGNQLPSTCYTPYTTPYDSVQLQMPPAQGVVETQLYQHQLAHYQNHMLQNSQYLHHYQAPVLSPPPVIPAGSYNVGGYAIEPQYSPLPPPVPPQPLPPAPVLQVPQHRQLQYHAHVQSASLPSYGMQPPFHQQQLQQLQQLQHYYDANNSTYTYPTTHYNTQHAPDVHWTHHSGVYSHFVSEPYYTPPAPPQPPAPK